ncbi:hypothetical protein CRUP_036736 [Coryphaenoides rupestris]|nr:hypothetical protein CRUP_036736 [Coryphaenoides rupestris]
MEHTVVDAHGKEEEHTGDNEDNTASLIKGHLPSRGGPNSTGPHSTMVTSPTALEKRCAPTRSIRVSNSTELSHPKAKPKNMA